MLAARFLAVLLALLAVGIGALPPAAAADQVPPVDEGERDPGFAAFRAELRAIIKARDSLRLQAIVADDVQNWFESERGKDMFLDRWKPASPDSRLWLVLGHLLDLGGTFRDDGSFTAPYVFSTFPAGHDSYVSAVVIRQNVAFRNRSAQRPAVPTTQLTHDIVELLEPRRLLEITYDQYEPGEQAVVRLSTGEVGWVEAQALRRVLDFRAGFEQRDGRWLLTSLVAGD